MTTGWAIVLFLVAWACITSVVIAFFMGADERR